MSCTRIKHMYRENFVRTFNADKDVWRVDILFMAYYVPRCYILKSVNVLFVCLVFLALFCFCLGFFSLILRNLLINERYTTTENELHISPDQERLSSLKNVNDIL